MVIIFTQCINRKTYPFLFKKCRKILILAQTLPILFVSGQGIKIILDIYQVRYINNLFQNANKETFNVIHFHYGN